MGYNCGRGKNIGEEKKLQNNCERECPWNQGALYCQNACGVAAATCQSNGEEIGSYVQRRGNSSSRRARYASWRAIAIRPQRFLPIRAEPGVLQMARGAFARQHQLQFLHGNTYVTMIEKALTKPSVMETAVL